MSAPDMSRIQERSNEDASMGHKQAAAHRSYLEELLSDKAELRQLVRIYFGTVHCELIVEETRQWNAADSRTKTMAS